MPKLLDKSTNQSSIIPWLVLMFLFALNFMSAGGYILLIMMGVYLMIHLREFSFRTAEVFLFLFGTEYFLFYLLWSQDVSFREVNNYLVAPWLLYWMGRSMAERHAQNDLPLRLATAMTLGFFSYALLCMAYSMYFAPPTAGARVMYTFWDHTNLSVTASGLLLSMPIGISMGHLTTKCKFRSKLFWLAVLGACIYYSFTWAHRTSIYIIAALIVYNYLEFLFTMNASPVQKLGFFAGSAFLAFGGILCLIFDVGGCYSWLQGQWLYQRLTNAAMANSGDRFLIWRSFFEQWLLYPLGGKQFDITASFVHNLWLDVYYLCGILPFAALVVTTAIIARNFFLFSKLRKSQNAHRTPHILANFYLAVSLAFMVEPVIEAYPYLFLAVLLISGSIEGSVMQTQRNCKNII